MSCSCHRALACCFLTVSRFYCRSQEEGVDKAVNLNEETEWGVGVIYWSVFRHSQDVNKFTHSGPVAIEPTTTFRIQIRRCSLSKFKWLQWNVQQELYNKNIRPNTDLTPHHRFLLHDPFARFLTFQNLFVPPKTFCIPAFHCSTHLPDLLVQASNWLCNNLQSLFLQTYENADIWHKSVQLLVILKSIAAIKNRLIDLIFNKSIA